MWMWIFKKASFIFLFIRQYKKLGFGLMRSDVAISEALRVRCGPIMPHCLFLFSFFFSQPLVYENHYPLTSVRASN